MYNFIVQLVFVSSLATLIYLLARALPRVSEEVIVDNKSETVFDRIVKNLPLEKLDINLHSFLGKTLRKIRVVVLRLDNGINGYLDQLKEYSVAQDEKSDLKEKMNLMAKPSSEEKSS